MAAAESARLAASHDDDLTALEPSPPATTSPSSPPTRSVTGRVATPLSLFLDSSSTAASRGGSGKAPASGSHAREDPFATVSPAETPEPSVSPGPAHADSVVDSVANVDGDGRPQRRDPGVATTRISGAAVQGPNSGRAGVPRYEPPTEVNARSPVAQMTNTTLPPDSDGEHDSAFSDARPLRTVSVRADTKFAHPKPMARPAPMNQPVSDLKLRPAPSLGNIAHLEATAERLSMTSSIDDAIRDLHGELKRSDSRRSSILAANVRAHPTDICNNSTGSNGEAAAVGQLKRHLSTSSSIVSTNIAARHGGYSPAAFVMSPNHSLTTGRLRSGSKNSAGRPDLDLDTVLSRHGPGKSSVRSVRSTKMSLAEISESDPVALNQEAFDKADAASPIEENIDESTLKLPRQDDEDVPSTDAFHQMLHDGLDVQPQHRTAEELDPHHAQHDNDEERPMSSHSNNTFQQCQDAFVDFDGVHWEPEDEEVLFVPPELETDMPTPRAAPAGRMRPQSYMDPETGQQMLYYPAKVPAMLNLPPKLSSRPKATQRNQRRSQILSAMMDPTGQPVSPGAKRNSAFTDMNRYSGAPELVEESWLPDPVAGQRDSFAALSSYGPRYDSEAKSDHGAEEPAAAPEAEPVVASDRLRRPQRLSAMDPESRKSKASLGNLPPQLRASAFFDLPSATAEVEIQDGSAMATLDSILDASANAPVSAFTDHAFAGALGSEIYGKAKKHKARKSTATLNVLSPEPKKRSSLMWLRKRSSSHDSEELKRPHSMAGAPVRDAGDESGPTEDRGLPSGNSEDNVIRVGEHEKEPEEEDSESDDGPAYNGPPTTLLAELQLRKQEQQERTKNRFPNGMHATLLDMDTVAEQQRKHRQKKRVNLAWEDPGAHLDQNGSDDEDVPLAILAAKQQGAKNLADLQRPMGMLERRDIEDNEPLSHRRARLQGLEPPPPLILPNRQSVLSFPALRAVDNRSPHSGMGPTPSPGPEEKDVDGETLGERRRRLAAKDGSDSDLPTARPVSRAFSAELLSQFGDPDDQKEKPAGRNENETPHVKVEDETLGQRRRRLQAEREAREREMGYGNLASDPMQQRTSRRLSMADVLAKKGYDAEAQGVRLRAEEEQRSAREREAKMAAMRKQMPQSLAVPNIERSGGFRGGIYNDGTAGYGPQAARSTDVVNTQGVAQAHYGSQNRSSVMLNNYGGPVQQPMYGAMSTFGGMNNMGAYNGMNNMGLYNSGSTMSLYGAGMASPGMQMPIPMGTEPVDRVEQWRRGVRP